MPSTSIKFKVLVTGSELDENARNALERIGARVELMLDGADESALATKLRTFSADAILMRGNPPITRQILECAPDLRVISKHGSGIDSVDLDAATERGVPVMHVGDVGSSSVAEMTVALILALRRDIVRLDTRVKAGKWDRSSFTGTELHGQTLGVIGYGRIGRRVAEIGSCLGLRILISTRSPTTSGADHFDTVSLDELLTLSDIVTIHCPLNSETRALFNKNRIGIMKHGALLINTSRGEIIDEHALAAALQDGCVGGAAVDTLSEEPPVAENPLLYCPNVIITPHVAAQTRQSIRRIAERAAANIVQVLSGEKIDATLVANQAILAA